MNIANIVFNNKKNIVLFFILSVGVFLRFYQLGQVPVGFHRDEAFLGYNAFSILLTGHDMTGAFLPLHLESFLYSPAGYSYFSILPIFFNGLNEFSIRLAAALFGSLTVLLFYFFVKKLFSHFQYKEQIALFSTFFLAISPWHINLSRVATENVLVVFFIILGVYTYLHSINNKKNIWILFSFLSFGFSLCLYQAPRSFLPLFIPLLFFIFHHRFSLKKNLLVGGFFLVTILIPILFVITSPNLSLRLQMLSIFKHPETQLVLDEQIREDGSYDIPLLVTRIYHNKVVNYSSLFFQNYFQHFSYDFLFTDSGLPNRYKVPNMGLLYFFEIPLIFLGMIVLSGMSRRIAIFLTGWILLAPVGSALTFDDIPNLQRTLLMLPAISILSGLGATVLWRKIGKINVGFTRLLLLSVIFYSVSFYLHQYYMHQVHHQPWHRQEGYRELIAKLDPLLLSYKEARIASSETSPGIFFLFYHAYSPLVTQQLISHASPGNYDMVSFNKYKFVNKDCPLDTITMVDPITGKKTLKLMGERNILYVNSGNCEINDPGVRTLSEIKRSDNTTVFRIQVLR